jgi:TonB family protein
MFTYALTEPRHPVAPALQSSLIHIALLAGAVVATKQIQAHGEIAPPPIDISFTVPRRTAPLCGCTVVSATPVPTFAVIPSTLGIPRIESPVGIPPIDPTTVIGDPVPGHVFSVGDSFTTSTILTESEVDELPALITAGVLRYPTILQESGIDGSVTLTFVIDTEGRVEPDGIQVLSSTQAGFVPAAEQAVLTSRFHPARKHGVPVRVRVRQLISFKH